jgi:uncharacterized protein YdhG (YjbR/CyaY superfamily)
VQNNPKSGSATPSRDKAAGFVLGSTSKRTIRQQTILKPSIYCAATGAACNSILPGLKLKSRLFVKYPNNSQFIITNTTVMTSDKPTTIDEYIAGVPADIQKILQEVREAIRSEAPGAAEKIGYGIPTFTLNGNLIHFAAFKNHIGLYPTPNGLEEFKEQLAGYKGAKGSVQFPLNQPMPIDLIKRITRFRVTKMMAKPKKK